MLCAAMRSWRRQVLVRLPEHCRVGSPAQPDTNPYLYFLPADVLQP